MGFHLAHVDTELEATELVVQVAVQADFLTSLSCCCTPMRMICEPR